MKVLLVDADSQKDFPNLALMKLSAWYRNVEHAKIDLLKGINTTIPLIEYDTVFISCIFPKNKQRVIDYARSFSCPVEIGGSGISYKKILPYDLEHTMPDYSLYGIDYSLGFTSRGCIRKCGFCIVHEKEGAIKDHAHINEFHHADHTKLILLDNNFLASPKWRDNLRYIKDAGLKVNFNQGLDIRLVTEKTAGLLADIKFQSWRFNNRMLSFAYDSPKHKEAVERGVQLLKDAGINGRSLMFYVLVGYDTTPNEDLDRIQHLIELGVDPYVMRYNQTEGPHRILKHMARWVNWRIYRNCSFMEYDESDSQESIKKVFKSPHSSWEGYNCVHGAYAWTERNSDTGDGQSKLQEFDQN